MKQKLNPFSITNQQVVIVVLGLQDQPQVSTTGDVMSKPRQFIIPPASKLSLNNNLRKKPAEQTSLDTELDTNPQELTPVSWQTRSRHTL